VPEQVVHRLDQAAERLVDDEPRTYRRVSVCSGYGLCVLAQLPEAVAVQRRHGIVGVQAFTPQAVPLQEGLEDYLCL
jgi:hypothetical protein